MSLRYPLAIAVSAFLMLQGAFAEEVPQPVATSGETPVERPVTPEAVLPEGTLEAPLRLQAEDPLTGEMLDIEVNSDQLTYDEKTGLYEAKGSAYLIIPKQETEVLADKITFNKNKQTMLATGSVYIINRGNVISTKRAAFNTEKNYSLYEEPKTVTDSFRLAAKDAQRFEEMTVIREGRLLVDQAQMKNLTRKITRNRLGIGNGSEFSYLTANWGRKYLINNNAAILNNLSLYDNTDDLTQGRSKPRIDEAPEITNKVISPQDVATADYSDDKSRVRVKVHRIDITKEKDGFDEVVFKRASAKVGKIPFFYFPSADIGYDQNTGYSAYLGPEFGYDIDNGGYHVGPGFDRRFANGWLKFVPFITYGQGRRRTTDINNPDLVSAQPGVGAQLSYLSQKTRITASYNTTLNAPRLLAEQRLFNRYGTRARFALNQSVNNGFYGIERPHWIGEIRDLRQRVFWDQRILMQTYLSAGMAEDEFLPNGSSRFFVAPQSNKPITTARFQAQFNMITSRPFIHIKDYLSLGALARGRLAYYGTGDHLGVLQAGPYLNLSAWRFFTQATYLSGLVSGQSPFVFDGYYGGNSSLRLVNSVDVSKNFSIGLAQNFNLSRSNARRDLVVGRQIFVSMGPEAVKFSFAYDIVQKRSFFGFTFNPEGGNLIVNFDRMNYFSPDYDESAMRPNESVIAPVSSETATP